MIENKSLENYLSKVFEELGEMPIAQRSDIIVDLHERIREKIQNESKSISVVLKEIGTPKSVAAAYQKGTYDLSPPSLRKRPLIVSVFRWITFSVATFLFLMFITLGAIIWKFTPIVKVTNDGMSFLGGAFQVKGRSGIIECPLPDYRGRSPAEHKPKDPTDQPGRIEHSSPGTMVEL